MNLYKEKIRKIKLLRNKLNFKQRKNNRSKSGVKINSIIWIKSCLNFSHKIKLKMKKSSITQNKIMNIILS